MASRSLYRRVVLKLSGEILQGDQESGISTTALRGFCGEIAELAKSTQFVIVVGGGNFWRFRDHEDVALDRTVSDNMGMLATVMNATALESTFASLGVPAVCFSAISMPKVLDDYTARAAISALEDGKIVISAGGTGNPFFSTDSAAALRGLELHANVVLKATNVDGVYDSDPHKNKNAKRFPKVSFKEVLEKQLHVMDLTAISLCQEGKLPIYVFDMQKKGNLKKVLSGENLGTLIS